MAVVVPIVENDESVSVAGRSLSTRCGGSHSANKFITVLLLRISASQPASNLYAATHGPCYLCTGLCRGMPPEFLIYSIRTPDESFASHAPSDAPCKQTNESTTRKKQPRNDRKKHQNARDICFRFRVATKKLPVRIDPIRIYDRISVRRLIVF